METSVSASSVGGLLTRMKRMEPRLTWAGGDETGAAHLLLLLLLLSSSSWLSWLMWDLWLLRSCRVEFCWQSLSCIQVKFQ